MLQKEITAELVLDAEGLALWAKHHSMALWYSRQPQFAKGIRIVVCMGQAKDWAAYMGPHDMEAGEIARSGDKLGAFAAHYLFPFIEGHYRR